MGFGTYDIGHYVAQYQPPGGALTAVGQIHERITIRRNRKTTDIRVDELAQTVVDAIYAGQDLFVHMVFKEWTTVLKALLNPDGVNTSTGAPDWSALGLPGTLDQDKAGQLVLTPLAGTPAATNGATYTFSKCILAPGHDVESLHGSDVENIKSALLRVFPFDDSGTWRFFTES